MPGQNQALEELRQADVVSDTLAKSDFALSDNVTGKKSVIATHKAKLPFEVPDGADVRLTVTAYETFSTNGTAGDAETFNLAENLTDSPVTENLILYEAGVQKQPDSVSISGDSFDYTDDGTNNTLHVFYVASSDAQIEVRKKSPSGVPQELFQTTASLAHTRDQYKRPLSTSYRYEEQGVVPAKWHLEVRVQADHTIAFSDNAGDGATAINAFVEIPIVKARSRIDGLSAAVRTLAANQG